MNKLDGQLNAGNVAFDNDTNVKRIECDYIRYTERGEYHRTETRLQFQIRNVLADF